MIFLLAKSLDRMVSEYGAYIVFMPTYNVSHEADDRICKQIIDKMRSQRTCLLPIHDPSVYKAVTGYLSVMLGGRMHSTILAAGAGTPVVGLAYNQKFYGFFELLARQEDVISVEDFVSHELNDELVALLSKAIANNWNPLPRVQKVARDIQKFNEDILVIST